MYYVYLLKDSNNKIYVGYTSDLKRRLIEHENGKVRTTSRMDKPELYYYEAYSTEAAARDREQKLKAHGSSYQGLLKRLQ